MEEKFGEFFQDKNYIKVKNSLFNYQNRKKEISKVFNKHKGNSKILALDIGSGISPVSPIPKSTLFMDLSKEGIEFLKKQGHNAKVGSITKIPEKNEKFDWVFCSEVLEHIKDYKKAVSEISRVIKKNGKVIITVPVHMKYWNIDDEFVEHYRRFNPNELRQVLENNGLKIIEEKPIGGIVERYLTLLIVKLFKSSKIKPINKNKIPAIIFINKILYLLVIFSLLFTNKKSTSIMLYFCEKK